MTYRFENATRYAHRHHAPSAWMTAVLAVASWLVIAAFAGLLLVLGTG